MPSLNTLWARALLQELQRSGARDVVICPGSRSAPLALAAAEAGPDVRSWVVLDERVAGFFALGLALESGRPTGVLVTSGSAGTHLFPALVEAWASGISLVVLTADRPWELHGFGAPQTMPQAGPFGRFLRHAERLPPPRGPPPCPPLGAARMRPPADDAAGGPLRPFRSHVGEPPGPRGQLGRFPP